MLEIEENASNLRGWRLVIGSAAIFLLPVILATIGAVWAGQNQNAQFLAAIIGLGGGAAVSVGIHSWLSPVNRNRT